MKKKVFCKFQFEALHRWENAPDEVYFLKFDHRHVFHVKAEKLVSDLDREVEFILLKIKLKSAIDELIKEKNTINWSCEMFAEWLMNKFDLDKVEVSEDNENGAIISR